jgi:GNAT superfamily N-acetyltransferase
VTRPARHDDAGRIHRLCDQLGYPTTARAIHDRMASLLASSRDGVFVAVDPARGVVGWIHVQAVERVESPPFAEIGGLVVDARLRGGGIGRSLVARAGRWADERGLGRVRVRTRVEREDARAFYARLDFREVKTQAVLDLDLARD